MTKFWGEFSWRIREENDMRTGYIGKNRGIALSIFMLLLFVLVGAIKVEDVDAAVIRTGVINIGVSNVRKGPSTSFSCLKHGSQEIKLKMGQTVTITDENTKWYKVTFYYSKKPYAGYIIKSNVKIKVPSLYYKGRVNTNNLNVRKSYSTSSDKVTIGGKAVQLNKNKNVHIIKTVKDWYYVRYVYGSKYYYGYVASKYINKITYSGKISASALYVRSGADTSKPIVKVGNEYVKLTKNTTVTICGIADKWYYISAKYKGKVIKGYVYSSYIAGVKEIVTTIPKPTVAPTPKPADTSKPTPTKSPTTSSTDKEDNNVAGKKAYTTATALNVRKGAGTSYAVLTSGSSKVVLEKGTVVNIISSKGNWYYVSFEFNGKDLKGYVSSDYVSTLSVTKEGAYGIDVSQYQGTINWSQVKASGIDFAIIRATRYSSNGEKGTKLVKDSKFETNIKNAIAAGIKVGVYVYSYADSVAEVVKEAELVCSYVKGYKLTYPVYFDIEEASRQKTSLKAANTNFAIAFCEKVKELGYKPGVYTGAGFFTNYLDVSKLTSYDLWIARYIYTTSYKLPNNKELIDTYM